MVNESSSPAGNGRRYTVWPPSTTIACPTAKEAASEHSHTTAAAISSGLPIRPIGSCAITSARPSGVPPLNRCIISVSMIPGQMAFMRMLDATWREYLFSDADVHQFADAYAQMVTYALLLARFSPGAAEANLDCSTALDTGTALDILRPQERTSKGADRRR